jgi:hypothetical protein
MFYNAKEVIVDNEPWRNKIKSNGHFVKVSILPKKQ